jgi:hypothetical protein
MDAASYAVERNRNLQDNVQKIIQMMLMGKQNKQEQDWRQGQFDYQKSQDTIKQGQQERSLDRQDAQQKRYEEYQQAQALHYANQDRLAAEKPVKVEPTLEDRVKERTAFAEVDAKFKNPAVGRPTPQGDKPPARLGKVADDTMSRYAKEVERQQKLLEDMDAVDSKGLPKMKVSESQRAAVQQRIKNMRVALDDMGQISYQLQSQGDLDTPTKAKLEGYSRSLGKTSTSPLQTVSGSQLDIMTRPMPQVKPGMAPPQAAAPVGSQEKPPSFEEVKKTRPGVTKEQYDRAVERWNKK